MVFMFIFKSNIILTSTYVSCFFHITARGTNCKDKLFLAVILHIRKYITAVSRNIFDIIAVQSSFSIHIRQCSPDAHEYYRLLDDSSLKQFHSSSHRKLLFFSELINISALYTAKDLGMLKNCC